MAAVSLVLDLVRVAAFLALGGYGVYENRVSIMASLFEFSRSLCGSRQDDSSAESGQSRYTTLVAPDEADELIQ